MKAQLDYPSIGVCSWRQWTQDAACYLLDKRGSYPATRDGWLRFRHCLRLVRQRPFSTNPWRRHFARDGMTPREAYLTIRGPDPDVEAKWLALENDFRRRYPDAGDGGQLVAA